MSVNKTIILIILIGLFSGPSFAVAAELIQAGTNNNTWTTALELGTNPRDATLYSRLNTTGDARYYSFSVTKPINLITVIETVPDRKKFEPRLVLYTPETSTIGPALPMTQPPLTMAVVYPANSTATHREGLFLTSITTRVKRAIEITKTGQYYLAVYDAGTIGGPFRFSISTTDKNHRSFSARLRSWWLTNLWLGPQYGILAIPLALAVAAAAAWLIVTKIPYPKPLAKRRVKRTISHARLSR